MAVIFIIRLFNTSAFLVPYLNKQRGSAILLEMRYLPQRRFPHQTPKDNYACECVQLPDGLKSVILTLRISSF